MVKCDFDIGQHIIKEGDNWESIYIIKNGVVKCMKGDVEVRQLSNKDYFGEHATLFGTKRTLTIVAAEKTTCFQICLSDLIENLGDHFKNTILKSITKEAFEKSKYMKLLIFDNYFNKIFNNHQVRTYKDDDIVMSKNENKKKIVILIEGNLHNSGTREIVGKRVQNGTRRSVRTAPVPCALLAHSFNCACLITCFRPFD